MTTTDRIRYCSVGRNFEGGEIKIDNPDEDGAGEVCVCVFSLLLGSPKLKGPYLITQLVGIVPVVAWVGQHHSCKTMYI